MKSFDQENAISTTTFRRLSYKGVGWILSNVLFKFYNFIWEKEGGRCEGKFLREESLEATQDYAEHIFPRKMLSRDVSNN